MPAASVRVDTEGTGDAAGYRGAATNDGRSYGEAPNEPGRGATAEVNARSSAHRATRLHGRSGRRDSRIPGWSGLMLPDDEFAGVPASMLTEVPSPAFSWFADRP